MEERQNNSDESSLEDKKYQNPELKKTDIPQVNGSVESKEMQKIREKLESLKKYINKKHKEVSAVGIIPPQAADMFDEENELTEEEKKDKLMHLVVILPSDKEKEFNEIKLDILNKIKEDKLKIWLNIFLEIDLWNICLDSKYKIIEAIGMAYPLFDKGILGALRVAQIHKSLALKKFEKYVYSYVIGGSLVRGEVLQTSDVDVYIIIDDTDVKRMPRLELKEKLRNIINSYVMQAGELAGVKNKLSPQVYLLTEFWEGVKDANPIFYTFLRDGVPIYDRGGFLPWKLLLKMGKIRPSPESIDMFMSMGDKTKDIVKRRMLDIVVGDIYWGIITPSQALLMLYGLPPTNVYETVAEVKRIFVDKEKLLEKKYWDILDEIAIKYYKGFEHGKVNEVSGKEIDKLLKDYQDYLDRLKQLREELEKRMTEKLFKEIYDNVFDILKNLFGKNTELVLIKNYEKEIVNSGKGDPRYLKTLNKLISMKKEFGGKKVPSKYDFESLRKESVYLIQDITEYAQRKELGLLQKTKVVVTFKDDKGDRHAELFLTKPAFLVEEQNVSKIENGKFIKSDVNEFNGVLSNYRGGRVVIDDEVIKILRKELGDFSISL
ncbi:MAG: nucleotidyltransferase domain-containing protein [Nanoarchaeota archaeon]